MKSKSLKKVLATALALSLVMAPVMGVNASTDNNAPSEGSSTSVSAEVAATIPETSTISVGGKYMTSTVKGAYMSKTIPGTVVVTDKATLAAGYGLVPGEQPYVRVYDISEAKSPAAMTSINAAAGAVGGTVVAKPGYAYAMICVRPGGVIEVLPDLDADPNTVTFSTTGGLGAYAMIMYPVA